MNEIIYVKEYWTGDSKDGSLVNGDGYHFFRMRKNDGQILEAFEAYETDEGEEVITRLPEMENISWIKDLGFEDLEALDVITEREYQDVKELANS